MGDQTCRRPSDARSGEELSQNSRQLTHPTNHDNEQTEQTGFFTV